MRVYFLILSFCLVLTSYAKVPKLNKDSFIIDISQSQILSPLEKSQLNAKLIDFDQKTSNQIAIVIVDDLDGMEINQYSTELFNELGLGSKKNNNGLLLLIKASLDKGPRAVYISTGYGLEGKIPDISCKEIIDKIILPNFKANLYYQGLDQATDILMKLAISEYKQGKSPKTKLPYSILIIFLMILLNWIQNRSYTIGSRTYYSRGFGGFWPGGLGGFGGGSFGGGDGFGGGLSGGGGAGSNW